MNKFSEGGVNQRKQQQALLMVMSQELRRGPALAHFRVKTPRLTQDHILT